MHPPFIHRGYVLHTYAGIHFASPVNVEEEGGAEFTSQSVDGLIRMINELLDSSSAPVWYRDWEDRGACGLINDPVRPVPHVMMANSNAFAVAMEQDNRVITETATIIDFARISRQAAQAAASENNSRTAFWSMGKVKAVAGMALSGVAIASITPVLVPILGPVALAASSIGISISGLGVLHAMWNYDEVVVVPDKKA